MKKKHKIIAATVIGALHQNKSMPCQDYYKYSQQGKNLVAVVSDGAGSAKYGKIGAKIVCDTLVDILKNADFKTIRERVVFAIQTAREKLVLHRMNFGKSEKNLGDFAATVVGVVVFQNQGLFFHIGDGAAIALKKDDYENFVASRPENGCFACETYFYTQEIWRLNLRFTCFDGAHNLFLMSDGLTSFSFNNDYNSIEKGFIVPINDFLSVEKNKIKAQNALINTLNTPKAQKLNSDDKTLLWVQINGR